jgi:hypothetical protein
LVTAMMVSLPFDVGLFQDARVERVALDDHPVGQARGRWPCGTAAIQLNQLHIDAGIALGDQLAQLQADIAAADDDCRRRASCSSWPKALKARFRCAVSATK